MTAAEKKKAIWLGGLVGVLGMYSIYTNFFSGPSSTGPASSPAPGEKTAAGSPLAMTGGGPKTAPRPKAAVRGRSDELHFVYIANRPEERPDPTKIDPTLRLDLLAKVQAVDGVGGARNLFAFGQPPPPPDALKGKETKVDLKPPGPPEPARPATDPSALPARSNLKYYGIVGLSEGGKKTACFLDTGEEILLGTEGDTLKRRFRVVKIGPTSVILRDTESNREETIPLAQEAKG
jgi:hypothetical protein